MDPRMKEAAFQRDDPPVKQSQQVDSSLNSELSEEERDYTQKNRSASNIGYKSNNVSVYSGFMTSMSSSLH